MCTARTKAGQKAGFYEPRKRGAVFMEGRPPKGTTPRRSWQTRSTGLGSYADHDRLVRLYGRQTAEAIHRGRITEKRVQEVLARAEAS